MRETERDREEIRERELCVITTMNMTPLRLCLLPVPYECHFLFIEVEETACGRKEGDAEMSITGSNVQLR